MQDLLDRAYRERRYVHVEARRLYTGFVLGLSESLVLVQDFHEFTPDGYAVVRRADIQAVESTVDPEERSLVFAESVIVREGTIARVGLGFSMQLETMASALRALIGQNELVLIHRGANVPAEVVLVGSVLAVDDLRLNMRSISTSAEWFAEEEEVITAHVELFEFGTPYLQALRKYAT